MKLLRSLTVCCLSLLLVAGITFDCGKKGPTFEEQIKALKEQGAPDSVLSSLKVHLSNVVNLGRSGGAQVRMYKDSLKNGLIRVQAWYEQEVQTSKPIMDNLYKSFVDRKATLSGLQLIDADSLLKIADSLIKKGWILQARTKLMTFDTIMNCLVQNEKKVKEIRPKLIGTWKDVHVIKPNEDEGHNFKATETRIYKFGADGSYEGQEEMHGQTEVYRKENWKFLTYGTYDLMGDTIYQFVTRENCVQQSYDFLDPKTNQWKHKEEKTYDSTITTHKKDRFITWDDLKLQFKKGK